MNLNLEQYIDIKEVGRKLDPEVSLMAVVNNSDGETARKLKEFCSELVIVFPQIRVRYESSNEFLSHIRIGDRVRFYAIPFNTELEPFFLALSYLNSPPDIGASLRKLLSGISIPSTLTVFVAQHCQFCPKVLKDILPLAFVSGLFRIDVIDGIIFPELARSHKIKSVPTVILEDLFRWTGTVHLEEILKTSATRDPSQVSPKTLEDIIKEGDADVLASMMAEQGILFPAFVELLVHPHWSVRLGAMVVAEILAEKAPVLAMGLIEPLAERLEKVDDTIKGDIIYIFGEMGAKAMIDRLYEIERGSDNEELKEAAREAIEKIRTLH